MYIAFGQGQPGAEHCYTNRIFKDVWEYDMGIDIVKVYTNLYREESVDNIDRWLISMGFC
jgi:hypothetical protein